MNPCARRPSFCRGGWRGWWERASHEQRVALCKHGSNTQNKAHDTGNIKRALPRVVSHSHLHSFANKAAQRPHNSSGIEFSQCIGTICSRSVVNPLRFLAQLDRCARRVRIAGVRRHSRLNNWILSSNQMPNETANGEKKKQSHLASESGEWDRRRLISPSFLITCTRVILHDSLLVHAKSQSARARKCGDSGAKDLPPLTFVHNK